MINSFEKYNALVKVISTVLYINLESIQLLGGGTKDAIIVRGILDDTHISEVRSKLEFKLT